MTLNEAFMEQLDKMGSDESDPWKVFIALVEDRVEPYIVTLRADIWLLKMVAQGLTLSSIANMTGISSKEVAQTAFTWGMEPLVLPLDFNPFLVYNRGDPPETLTYRLNEILPIPVSLETVRQVTENLERYYELLDILDDEERKVRNDSKHSY